jgi:hypothetical protein
MACGVVAASVGYNAWNSNTNVENLKQELELLQAQASKVTKPTGGKPAAQDFTATLPPTPDGHEVLKQFQAASRAHRVQWISSSVATRTATTTTLGRQEITVALSGRYVDIKASLSQALSALPHTVVERLTLQRSNMAPELLEAVCVVSALGSALTTTKESP